MARIDDYRQALSITLTDLRKSDIHQVARKSGAKLIEAQHELHIECPFMEDSLRINVGEGKIVGSTSGEEIPIQEQVLVLHYLINATGNLPMNEWIAYRELPEGSFYHTAFVGRSIIPFKKAFGDKPEAFRAAAMMLKGDAVEEGDIGFVFKPFPYVPVKLLLWKGDDEFPPEAGILFDRTISQYLSAEDTAWLAGMLVFRLISLSRKAFH